MGSLLVFLQKVAGGLNLECFVRIASSRFSLENMSWRCPSLKSLVLREGDVFFQVLEKCFLWGNIKPLLTSKESQMLFMDPSSTGGFKVGPWCGLTGVVGTVDLDPVSIFALHFHPGPSAKTCFISALGNDLWDKPLHDQDASASPLLG